MIASRKSELSAEAELDQALLDPEGLLSRSLQTQDRQRRRRLLGVAGLAICFSIGVLAVTIWPSSVSALDGPSRKTEEARQLWMERKLEGAELAYLDAIRLNEADIAAWNGLGWTRNNQGKYDTALEAFEKCLELSPDHGAAQNGMGQSLLAKGDYPAASKWLLRGTETYFKSVPEQQINAQSLPAALHGLIQVSLLTEKYANAEKWSAKFLKYSPDDNVVQAYSAAAKAKDNTEIKGEFKRMQEHRKTASLWKQSSENPSQAIDGFRQLLKKDGNDVGALNGLGFLLLNSGKHAEAKPLFEKCVKLSPQHYGAMNGLARCCKEAGDTGEAIRIWKSCCDKIPQVNAATAGLAMTYFEQKDYKNALPFLKQLTSSKTWSSKQYEAMLAEAEAGQKAE